MTKNQEMLVRRLRGLADKIENMSEQDFNNYEEITNSFEGDMSHYENMGGLDDTCGQIDEEVAILTFINSDKEKGGYTVE